MSRPSRMDAVHRRLRITRYAIGVIAAGVFAGGAVAVRAAHPGTHGHHSTSAQAQAAIPGESSSLLAAANSLTGSSSSGSSDDSGSSSSSGSSDDSGSSSSPVSPAPAASAPVVQSSGS